MPKVLRGLETLNEDRLNKRKLEATIRFDHDDINLLKDEKIEIGEDLIYTGRGKPGVAEAGRPAFRVVRYLLGGAGLRR